MKKFLNIFLLAALLIFSGPHFASAQVNSVHLLTPNGGETYKVGDVVPITWTTSGFISKVTISITGYAAILPDSATQEQKLNNVTYISNVVVSYITNTGQYNWFIDNLEPANYYQLQIDPENSSDGYDSSDGYFTIDHSHATGNAPELFGVSPDTAVAGDTINISGSGMQATNKVLFENDENGSMTAVNASSSDGTHLQAQVPDITPGYYYVSYGNGNGLAGSAYGFHIEDSTATAHSPGTNVLGSDGTIYFISANNTRSPYTSAGAFLSYKFNSWAGVQQATSGDMALPLSTFTPVDGSNERTYFIPPRNGALINDKGTVYLMTNGLRTGFASEAAFKGLGYKYSNVYPGDTSFMLALAPITSSNVRHSDGALINDNGTIYVMVNGTRMGFPRMSVFDSWGYWISEAAPANSYDRQTPSGSTIPFRDQSQLNIGTNQPVVDLKVNGSDTDQVVNEGSTVTLSWTSANANNCYFDGEGSLFTDPRLYNAIDLNGQIVISNVSAGQNGDNTISLVCYNTAAYPSTSNFDTINIGIISNSPSAINDQKRVTDVRQIASALELYFNDCNSYPVSAAPITLGTVYSLSSGTASACGNNTGTGTNGGIRTSSSGINYIQFPSAPTPSDGACTAAQNNYIYTGTNSNYSLTFCLGGATGGLGAGVRTQTQGGIQ